MGNRSDSARVFIADAVHTFHRGTVESLPRGIVVRAGRIEGFADPEDRHERRDWSGLDVHDLSGTHLVPGFFDAHNHQPTAARDVGLARTSHARNLGELLDALSAAASDRPPGEWIVTEHSLTESQLGRSGLPTAMELESATPRHPTAVRFGAHAMALNHLALQKSGIAALDADPPEGVIARDLLTGEPTGPIFEYGALAHVLGALAPREPERDVSAMRQTQRDYARIGVTSVRVPGLRPGDLAVYQSLLRADGRLRTRVFGGPRIDPTDSQDDKLSTIRAWEVSTGFGSSWLRLDALKIFVDGGFESCVRDRPHLFLDEPELGELVRCAVGRGWSVTCHAVSPEAIELCLNVYEGIAPELPAGQRLVIEHGFFATRAQLKRASRCGVWLSTQPAIGYMDARLLREHLDPESVARAFPLATALRYGVPCALGSDWNATPGTTERPFNPLDTIRAATTRIGADGGSLGEGEVITAEQAFHLHTRAPAELVGAKSLGGLWVGARADLVALDGDPLGDLSGLGVAATAVGGLLLTG